MLMSLLSLWPGMAMNQVILCSRSNSKVCLFDVRIIAEADRCTVTSSLLKFIMKDLISPPVCLNASISTASPLRNRPESMHLL